MIDVIGETRKEMAIEIRMNGGGERKFSFLGNRRSGGVGATQRPNIFNIFFFGGIYSTLPNTVTLGS